MLNIHIDRIPVRIVEKIKQILHCETWHVEAGFVFLVLAATAIISNRGLIEWIGVFAVWFTWNHASVANSLEEAQAKEARENNAATVSCYRWITRYFYIKEVLWFAYFILIGAWSALVGCIIFLLYGWWRHTWRKYHPLNTNYADIPTKSI